MGLDDIRSGRRKTVFVGNSEAPLLPAIIEGFNAMGALATKERLQKLDQTPTLISAKPPAPSLRTSALPWQSQLNVLF